MEKPSRPRAALLGVAVGIAALVKFTALLFLAASALGIVAARALFARPSDGTPGSEGTLTARTQLALQLCISVAVAASSEVLSVSLDATMNPSPSIARCSLRHRRRLFEVRCL